MTVTAWELKERQALPLETKVNMSLERIKEWYKHWDGQVYVSFSGGKDSTVLLHLVRQLYSDVPAVFVDTGLEYPEIRQFVKTVDNVTWLRPKMPFNQVIEKYGYPVVSKRQAQCIREAKNTKSEALYLLRMTGIRKNGKFSSYSKISNKWQYLVNAPFKISDKCCHAIKKKPMDGYVKEVHSLPFIGVMASDGANRELDYIRNGCNIFDSNRPASRPLAFWNEEDIWQYLYKLDVPYSKIYDMGYHRTGCMFCGFGVHLEQQPNRFQRMKQTHPTHWRYCMDKLGLRQVLEYIGVPYE